MPYFFSAQTLRAVNKEAHQVIDEMRRQFCKIPGLVKVSSAALIKTLFNSEGTLDNAKKLIEEREFGDKGSKAHATAVVGNAFGDPLKDTAGPSLHILVQLQNIMPITLLPLYIKYGIKLISIKKQSSKF